MFLSPITRCVVIHEMVRTDQSHAECARKNDCSLESLCPLCGYFAEHSRMHHAQDETKHNTER